MLSPKTSCGTGTQRGGDAQGEFRSAVGMSPAVNQELWVGQGGEVSGVTSGNTLKNMAGTTRLELATSAVTGQRSNQLNYVPAGG